MSHKEVISIQLDPGSSPVFLSIVEKSHGVLLSATLKIYFQLKKIKWFTENCEISHLVLPLLLQSLLYHDTASFSVKVKLKRSLASLAAHMYATCCRNFCCDSNCVNWRRESDWPRTSYSHCTQAVSVKSKREATQFSKATSSTHYLVHRLRWYLSRTANVELGDESRCFM